MRGSQLIPRATNGKLRRLAARDAHERGELGGQFGKPTGVPPTCTA